MCKRTEELMKARSPKKIIKPMLREIINKGLFKCSIECFLSILVGLVINPTKPPPNIIIAEIIPLARGVFFALNNSNITKTIICHTIRKNSEDSG